MNYKFMTLLAFLLVATHLGAYSTCETRVDSHQRASTSSRVAYCLNEPPTSPVDTPRHTVIYSEVDQYHPEIIEKKSYPVTGPAYFRGGSFEVNRNYVDTLRFPVFQNPTLSQQEILAEQEAARKKILANQQTIEGYFNIPRVVEIDPWRREEAARLEAEEAREKAARLAAEEADKITQQTVVDWSKIAREAEEAAERAFNLSTIPVDAEETQAGILARTSKPKRDMHAVVTTETTSDETSFNETDLSDSDIPTTDLSSSDSTVTDLSATAQSSSESSYNYDVEGTYTPNPYETTGQGE